MDYFNDSKLIPDLFVGKRNETFDDPGGVVRVNDRLDFALDKFVEFGQKLSLKTKRNIQPF